MLRLIVTSLMVAGTTAQSDCTSAQCCTAIKHGMCTGNTHAAPVGDAAPVVNAGAGDHTCTGATHHLSATAATTTCASGGCTDTDCCTAHSTPTCSAGQELTAGTATADAACTACAAGKFNADGTGSCAPHATPTCGTAGEGRTAGDASTDVICAACATGKFALAGDDTCTDLTATCPAGQGFTAQVTPLETDNTCAACTVGTDFNGLVDALPCAAVSTSPPTSCPAGQGLVAASASADAACVWCTSNGGTAGVATYKTATDGSACLDQTTPTCSTAGEGRTTGGPGTAVVCAACPSGKFALAGDDTCTAHTACDDGEATTAGTASADATCAPCAAGKTSTAGGACTDITGYCTNVVDAAARGDATVASGAAIVEFECAAGEYVAGNVQSTAVASVAAGCHEDAGVADGTCTLAAHTGGNAATPAVDAVTATATVYGVAAVSAVAAVDPTCTETGCSYSAAVTGSAASDAICPAPTATGGTGTAKQSGAAAAAPALAVAALVAALV